MILNRQKKVRLATRPLQEFLRKTQRELGVSGSEITVALVSDGEIAKWNEAYRKKSGPTDVLSFSTTSDPIHGAPASPNTHPYPPLVYTQARRATRLPRSNRGYSPLSSESACPNSPRATQYAPLFLGDIAIAPETAKRYAVKNGRTLSRELRVLILHGVLHLLGYDHECDSGQMNKIERKLRRRLGIA